MDSWINVTFIKFNSKEAHEIFRTDKIYYNFSPEYFIRFNSKEVHEDEIFDRQDVLQFFGRSIQ